MKICHGKIGRTREVKWENGDFTKGIERNLMGPMDPVAPWWGRFVGESPEAKYLPRKTWEMDHTIDMAMIKKWYLYRSYIDT